MNDTVEVLRNGSKIQHGKLNDRIYLMKLAEEDCPEIIDALQSLAKENNYTKIFCKVPKWAGPLFMGNGYMLEAFVPKFYNNLVDAFFVSKFLSSDRLLDIETTRLNELSRLLSEKDNGNIGKKKVDPAFRVRRLGPEDVGSITKIYAEVFQSYPFPIHDPDYILKTMQDHIHYYGVEKGDRMIALSSAETDREGQNAEMTDFATSFGFQGNNLSCLLLDAMEQEMKKQGIRTLYTIARLNSTAMNKTFLRFDYIYSGTLIKNTNIAGKIESMNVYYKPI
jgi:putative beta-lysine N-acetyltransferase